MDYFLNISRDGFVEVVCCCLGLGVDNNFNSCVKSNIVVDAADKQRIYIVAGLFKWGYSG